MVPTMQAELGIAEDTSMPTAPKVGCPFCGAEPRIGEDGEPYVFCDECDNELASAEKDDATELRP